jgi:SAM-dependent methyltransferase
MPLDLRTDAARYYDLSPNRPGDVAFYLERLPGPSARVLELGCGTGRVSIPLAQRCGYLHGLDLSEAMLDLCRKKIAAAGLGRERIIVEQADITDYDLDATFDLIIAPFRVIQNLETDAQLAGLFQCIRAHLAPEGRCILNVFHPNRPRGELLSTWTSDKENLAWEVEHNGKRKTCHDARRRLVEDPLVLYPELIYRTYEGDQLVDETVLPIPMRCFYPDEFLELIRSAGYTVTGSWGGYAGESYGEGGELVVEFTI